MSTVDPHNCVHWNKKTQRYELVIDGKVCETISRLCLKIPRLAARFRHKVLLGIQVRNELRTRREAIADADGEVCVD